MIYVLWLVPTSICFAIAGYMAVNSVEGWGWFLFIGLLTFVYPASKDDKS